MISQETLQRIRESGWDSAASLVFGFMIGMLYRASGSKAAVVDYVQRSLDIAFPDQPTGGQAS